MVVLFGGGGSLHEGYVLTGPILIVITEFAAADTNGSLK